MRISVRALAASTGNADMVTFVPLKGSAKISSPPTGVVDLLSRNRPWTLVRGALECTFRRLSLGRHSLVPATRRECVRAPTVPRVCREGTSSRSILRVFCRDGTLSVEAARHDSASEAANAFLQDLQRHTGRRFGACCPRASCDAPEGHSLHHPARRSRRNRPGTVRARRRRTVGLTLVRCGVSFAIPPGEDNVTRRRWRLRRAKRIAHPVVERPFDAGDDVSTASA